VLILVISVGQGAYILLFEFLGTEMMDSDGMIRIRHGHEAPERETQAAGGAAANTANLARSHPV
jgi:hypothetical protein